MTHNLVLKLCKKRDQEPDIFEKGQSVGAYPKNHASNECTILITEPTKPNPTWYAWVSDYAQPLDELLKKCPDAADICIVGAIRAMLRAHSIGHILSDNALYNFGFLQGNVVIIDAGSR